MKRFVATQEWLDEEVFWGVWDTLEKKLLWTRLDLKETKEEAQKDADLLNDNKVVVFPNLLFR